VTTLLHNEWLKLRTTRVGWLLLIIPQIIVAYGAITVIIGSGDDAQKPEQMAAAAAHVGLVSVFVFVLGILATAGEYRHKTITDTYLSTPRRGRVLLAKFGFYALVGAAFGVAGALIDVVTIAIVLSARGFSFHLWNPNLWLSLLGSIVWNALFAVLGVAVGALIRNLWAAIIVSLVFLYLIEGAINQVATDFSFWLPFAAGESMARVPEAEGLPPVGAGLLLAGYVALFAVLAIGTSARRDIA
jgi:ABC-2 type transport system permease protein